MKLSIIISTYNSPEWLEKVLWGYQKQTFLDFEILIADDGSNFETADLIHKMKNQVSFPLHHIWQKDEGFRKCEILNKAILASSSEYLIFSDGDCIPRADFVEQHHSRMKANHFLSGGTVRLPLQLSKITSQENIKSQEVFDKFWLLKNGLKISFLKKLKLTKNKSLSEKLNRLTLTKATWNGGNSSAWKKDILAVNGFEERMHYGSEDREFGERMINNGIHGIQIRYSAISVHLDHNRSYSNETHLKENKQFWKNTKQFKSCWTPYGLIKAEK
ncbi:MAG: glycosyltransferase family 2 protein [Ginsengibacter sp.]